MNLRYLVIEGNIGAGKTSLSEKIAEDFNAKLILERFADNPFLPKFYEDPDKYAFPLEMSFLADRYNQLKNQLDQYDLFNNLIVSDYFFVKSLIFSANTLKEDEYQLYRKLFDIIYSKLPKPDLYIYLHKNVYNLLENIKKRGRSYEQNISADYLKKIEDSYFKFFNQEPDLNFLIVETDNIDFVNNEDDYKKVVDCIFNCERFRGIRRIFF